MYYRMGLVILLTAGAAWGAAPPGKTRELTAAEQKEVAALVARFNRHAAAGEFEQAAKVAQQIADYRQKRQGTRHHQATNARFEVEEWKRLAAVPVKDRAEVVRARRLNHEGLGLLTRGRAREAEKPLREALLIRETSDESCPQGTATRKGRADEGEPFSSSTMPGGESLACI